MFNALCVERCCSSLKLLMVPENVVMLAEWAASATAT